MKKKKRLCKDVKDSKDYKDPSEIISIVENMNRLEIDMKELIAKPINESFTLSIT